jgi:CDP-paratose 2-epimerase
VHVVVTGGAGFVGSNLALAIRGGISGARVTAFDNLHRRGSEQNIPRLLEAGVQFLHGDVRSRSDLELLPPFDVLLECSAEPSAVTSDARSRDYLLDTNVRGAIHCAELCTKNRAALLFLSSSRVYPIRLLEDLELRETDTRYELRDRQRIPGVSEAGVSEDFPLEGPRSFYGASKYAAEVVLREYAHACDLPLVVNRCGVIAGPWQFGKVDQGVVAYWVISHCRGEPLTYIGFGGAGKQVRDVLHVSDLADLVLAQIQDPRPYQGRTLNVGGGCQNAVSLVELTELCRSVTGKETAMGSEPETRYADVPLFITDHSRITDICGWRPQRPVAQVVADIYAWIQERDSPG